MQYLSAANIIAINTLLQQRFGTAPSIRDAAALNYIVQSAQQEVFGRPLYGTVLELASFYLIKVTKKHVFNDANKRTAFQAAAWCLQQNGYELKTDCQIQVADQIIRIAQADGEPDNLWQQTEELLRRATRKLQ